MAFKKILILSINAGGGHIAAMNSLAQALEDSEYDIKKIIIEKDDVENLHKFLVTSMPYLYELLYNLSRLPLPNFINDIRIDIAGIINGLGKYIKKINTIEEYDVIISTHFLITEQLIKFNFKKNTKIINYVPDFDNSNIHICSYKGRMCDGYIVQSDRLSKKIMLRGGKSMVGRYVVPNEFKNESNSINNLLDTNGDKKNIIITGGALWAGKILPKIQKIIHRGEIKGVRFIFITGKSKELLNKISKLSNDQCEIIGLPFLNHSELSYVYSKADLFILASIAPATLFEIIYKKKAPIFLARINPGQEYFNMKYAVRKKLVTYLGNTERLGSSLEKFLNSENFRESLAKKSFAAFEEEEKSIDKFISNLPDFIKSL